MHVFLNPLPLTLQTALSVYFITRECSITGPQLTHHFTLQWQDGRKCPTVGQGVKDWPFQQQVFVSRREATVTHTVTPPPTHTQDELRRQPIKHNKALTSWLTWQQSRNSCRAVTGHTRGEWRNSVCWHACAAWEFGSALRLYRRDKTGVVSVGEMSHKVKRKLHSSEERRIKEKSE